MTSRFHLSRARSLGPRQAWWAHPGRLDTPPSFAAHSHGVSVRPEGLPAGSLRPGVAGTLTPCHTGEAAGIGHKAGV